MGPLPPVAPDERRPARRDARFVPVLVGPAGSAALRRLASLTILVAIDLTACFAGIYAALAFKLVVQGDPVDPGAIWAVEQKALPVAAATMILIFAKNRLYAAREVRGGAAAIVLVGDARHRARAGRGAAGGMALRDLLHLLLVVAPRLSSA